MGTRKAVIAFHLVPFTIWSWNPGHTLVNHIFCICAEEVPSSNSTMALNIDLADKQTQRKITLKPHNRCARGKIRRITLPSNTYTVAPASSILLSAGTKVPWADCLLYIHTIKWSLPTNMPCPLMQSILLGISLKSKVCCGSKRSKMHVCINLYQLVE